MTAPGGDAVADLLARLQATTAELESMAVQQQAEWDQARAQWAEEDEERSRLARNGELGPQWQKLQQRIDLGETSVLDVVHGRDESVEAELVMTDARRRAAELGAELEVEKDEGRAPELQAQSADMAELTAMLDELRAMTPKPPPPAG